MMISCRLRAVFLAASCLILGPSTSSAQAPSEKSCAQLLGELYKSSESKKTVESFVRFEGGESLRLDDPGTLERIRTATGVLQVGRLEDVKKARQLVKRAQRKDLLVTWSASERFDPAVLRRSPSSIKVFLAIPTTQSAFKSIYGTSRPVRENVLKQYKARVGKLTPCDYKCSSILTGSQIADVEDLAAKVGGGAGDQASAVAAHVKSQRAEELTIITGHIDASGELRFPDGSAVSVSALKGSGQTWIIGCDSVRHLTTGVKATNDIILVTQGRPDLLHAFDVTVKLLDSLTKAAGGGQGASGNTYEDAFRYAHKRGFEFLVPLTGVAFLIKALDDEDDDKKKNPGTTP